ncbi:MAG: glycosyltransferase family 2 protein [Rhodothermales bacterium]
MKNKSVRIAAILASHNRKDLTMQCLSALFTQRSDQLDIRAFLLDDGSTDGTSEAVKASFPEAEVIKGDGSYFWNEGMRTAFAAALSSGADYYLWLNDDTNLAPDAVMRLVETHQKLQESNNSRSIVVGSVKDPVSSKLTYGGMIRDSKWHPFHFKLVEPTNEAMQCDVMHGNCVLIPDEVARMVGNMDAGYSHAIGDIDYALKAGSKGASIWITPGFVGTCSTNPVKGSWLDTSLPLKERWKQMSGPKGLPPSDWMLFSKKHAGLLWPVFGSLPYVRLVLSSIKAKIRPQELHPIA